MDKKKINIVLNNNYIQKPKSKKSTKSTKSPKSSNELNINHFCKYNNRLFKKIYLFLKCPRNIIILMKMFKMLEHPKVQQVVLKEIKNNKNKIQSILNDFNVIMDFYKTNNQLLKSEIGHFILYYEYNLTKVKVKTDKDYLLFIKKIINYPKLISLLREIFYILSDYRLCIYYSTPNIDFKNTTKTTMDEFVQKFKTNQVILFSTISRIYPGNNSPWGKFYANAYSAFESLFILKKYYQDPLRILKIEFKYRKKNNQKQIIKKLETIYNIKLQKIDKIVNVTNYIILMKKLKYDMHEVVDSIFDIIYEGNTIKNVESSEIITSIKLFKQKKNYELGVKIYILVNQGYITNMNCFQKFSI